MTNEYGLDTSYFKNIIMRMHRDIKYYTPEEFARQCARMASIADQKVLSENEFKATQSAQQVNAIKADALDNQQLKARVARLEDAMADISSACIGEIAMGYKLDAMSIGESIYQATGMTNEELNKAAALREGKS